MPNEFWKKIPTSVLIVDDNPGNRLAVEVIVRPLADRVDVVASGREALAQCERHAYSLVLMDVMMPEMDGIEAARLPPHPTLTSRSGKPIVSNDDSENGLD